MPVRSIGLELTDRCDLACSHCFRQVVPPNSARARDLDFQLLRKIVAEARPLGVEFIGLTGGEPMLHPRFLDILDTIVDGGLRYHFLSNGLGLPALVPQLFERPERRAGLRKVCVSLEGATEATHDRIRGKGSFRGALAGIAVLKAMGIPFTLLTTVNRINRHEIEPIGLLAHHLGAVQLYYTHFFPNGRPHATDDMDLTISERHEAEAIIRRLTGALRLSIGMGEGFHVPEVDYQCTTVRLTSLNVDASGHVTFCCELSSFNGDRRKRREQSDFIADLSEVSVAEAVELQKNAIARFRAERLQTDRDGRHTEDDKFACRFCVRHFGKPEQGVVPLRRVAGTRPA
jgi:MoaA/NifB/PqqE/SkfB family radical SAM enzyme